MDKYENQYKEYSIACDWHSGKYGEFIAKMSAKFQKLSFEHVKECYDEIDRQMKGDYS